ncbi:hypothetical protein [Synechococcus sp. CBW1004]|jgi:hypothetical protein|uniref:hypothetical protein n=1 Tax=Synechococcus sp. CBW1004 TaxID=1353136 RepID=UPI0018CF3F2B|nr:hypothetical protein [Synechococcus sp. CBW1004]QPN63024.1 hypothetical protein H8F25_15570 [Synechococcus sp. CBW1004]
MIGVCLVVLLTLAVHQWLVEPFAALLHPLLHGSWAPWALLLLGVWLFAGSRRSP